MFLGKLAAHVGLGLKEVCSRLHVFKDPNVHAGHAGHAPHGPENKYKNKYKLVFKSIIVGYFRILVINLLEKTRARKS